MPVKPADPSPFGRRHLAFGWWSLFVFTLIGVMLESLHAFKITAYVDGANETRRLMWTLAHAHGALLSIVNIVFAIGGRVFPEVPSLREQWLSRCLMAATVLLPGGFFLGGVRFYSGDPGLGVALVPIGAALLLLGAASVARGSRGGTHG